MDFCHQHNLVVPAPASGEKRYGIRVTLPAGDTFDRLLGSGWEKIHWYATEAERDAAFREMSTRHMYYRKTDDPTQVLTKIVR